MDPAHTKPRGLFPDDPYPPRSEKLRVLKRGAQYTTVLVLRTESDPEPIKWHLLSERIPEGWVEGANVGIRYTPMELDWLQGLRDLPELPPRTD
jgi:hypothetical protein